MIGAAEATTAAVAAVGSEARWGKAALEEDRLCHKVRLLGEWADSMSFAYLRVGRTAEDAFTLLFALAHADVLSAHMLAQLSTTCRCFCCGLGNFDTMATLSLSTVRGFARAAHMSCKLVQVQSHTGVVLDAARRRLMDCSRIDVQRLKHGWPPLRSSELFVVVETVAVLLLDRKVDGAALYKLVADGRVCEEAAAAQPWPIGATRKRLFLKACAEHREVLSEATSREGALGALAIWLEAVHVGLTALRELADLSKARLQVSNHYRRVASWLLRHRYGVLHDSQPRPPKHLLLPGRMAPQAPQLAPQQPQQKEPQSALLGLGPSGAQSWREPSARVRRLLPTPPMPVSPRPGRQEVVVPDLAGRLHASPLEDWEVETGLSQAKIRPRPFSAGGLGGSWRTQSAIANEAYAAWVLDAGEAVVAVAIGERPALVEMTERRPFQVSCCALPSSPPAEPPEALEGIGSAPYICWAQSQQPVTGQQPQQQFVQPLVPPPQQQQQQQQARRPGSASRIVPRTPKDARAPTASAPHKVPTTVAKANSGLARGVAVAAGGGVAAVVALKAGKEGKTHVYARSMCSSAVSTADGLSHAMDARSVRSLGDTATCMSERGLAEEADDEDV